MLHVSKCPSETHVELIRSVDRMWRMYNIFIIDTNVADHGSSQSDNDAIVNTAV